MIDYETGHFIGMNFIWWFLWIGLLIWIFATPYKIPGQRIKKDSPLDMLRMRLAKGEINSEEFKEKKELIEAKSLKQKI